MKTGLTTAVLFFLISTLHAQDSLRVKNHYTEGEFSVGYLQSNFSGINSFLTTNGLDPISRNRFNLGFWAVHIRNKFAFGSGIDLLVPSSESQTDNRTNRLEGYSYGFLLGYLVRQRKSVTIYPYAKLYSNFLSLKIIDNQPVADASSLLTATTRNVSMDYHMATMDFGLSLTKNFSQKNKGWDCPQTHRYLALGLKIGYFFTVGNNLVYYNNQMLSGAPSMDYRGPYVKVSFGIGTKFRELKWQ